MGPILWTKHFLAEQGYNYKQVLHQDNKSAMLLESNGRKSAGKRSRHINIRYFFISDMKEKGQLSIRYCPTDKLVAALYDKTTTWIKVQRIQTADHELVHKHNWVSNYTTMCVFSLWRFSGF